MKDSLAGVSIKYGITLQELRKVNQLWANDSIHLRKELYIPIDRANRAHEYLPSLRRLASSASEVDPQELLIELDHPTSASVPSAGSPPSSSTEHSPYPTLRKIPVSQLSFFPPSTNTSRAQNSAPTSSTTSVELPSQRSPYLKPSNPSYRPGTHSLTTLLTALPINASTRDEIVSRISIDSSNSGYSDVSRSRMGSDEEMGHELEDIQSRLGASGLNDHQNEPSPSMITPRPYFGEEIPLKTDIRHSTSLHTPTYNRPLLSTSPPSSYVAQQPYNPYIRTQQLEPSPVMQVPSRDAYRTVDSKGSDSFAQKSPLRHLTSTESRKRALNNGRILTTSDIERGIELGGV